MLSNQELEKYRKDRPLFRAVHRIMEDGRRYGDIRTDVQERNMFAPLVERRQKFNFFKLSRGWDKTSGLAAWYPLEELLLGPRGQEIPIVASTTDQGLMPLSEIKGFLDRNPKLGAMFRVNKNEITHRNGRIVVMSSDGPSSYGTKSTLYIIDEFSSLRSASHRELFFSFFTACSKRKDAQLVCLSNAGANFSTLFFEMIDKIKGSGDWYYFETKNTPPWMSERDVQTQRDFLPPTVFARLFGNMDIKGAGNFITSEDLERCVDLDLMPVGVGAEGKLYGVGLDFGRVRDRAAVAIAHKEGANVVLDDVRWWAGSHDRPVQFASIEDHLLGVSKNFQVAKALFDPHQTQHLMERLLGILPVEEFAFSQKSWNELASPFYNLLHFGRLKIYPSEMIETELLMLELKQTPAGVRFDHSRGGYSDISTAIALAAFACLKMGDGIGDDTCDPGGRLAAEKVQDEIISIPNHFSRRLSGESRRLHDMEHDAAGEVSSIGESDNELLRDLENF